MFIMIISIVFIYMSSLISTEIYKLGRVEDSFETAVKWLIYTVLMIICGGIASLPVIMLVLGLPLE